MSERYEFGPFRRNTTVAEDARLTIEVRDPEWVEKYGYGALHVHLPHDCGEWTIGDGDEEELVARLTELRESVDEALSWLEERKAR